MMTLVIWLVLRWGWNWVFRDGGEEKLNLVID